MYALVPWRVIGPHYHCVYTTLRFGERAVCSICLSWALVSRPLFPSIRSLSPPSLSPSFHSNVSSNTLFRSLSHAHIHVHTALQADNPKQTCVMGPRNVHICKHSNQPSKYLTAHKENRCWLRLILTTNLVPFWGLDRFCSLISDTTSNLISIHPCSLFTSLAPFSNMHPLALS